MKNCLHFVNRFIHNENGTAAQEASVSYVFVLIGIVLLLLCVYYFEAHAVRYIGDDTIRMLTSPY